MTQENIITNNENMGYLYIAMYRDYPDAVNFRQLKEMLGIKSRNKIYKILQNKEIYSKRIGRDYIIPKTSVIDYLFNKK